MFNCFWSKLIFRVFTGKAKFIVSCSKCISLITIKITKEFVNYKFNYQLTCFGIPVSVTVNKTFVGSETFQIIQYIDP